VRATLRFLGGADIVSGVVALVDATWFAEQLGVSATAVRVVAALTVLVGVDTLVLAGRPIMAKVGTAIEAVVALAALDLAVLGDANGTGTVMLVAIAVYCTAAVVRLVSLQRTPDLVAA
jgi:hypothetical protein